MKYIRTKDGRIITPFIEPDIFDSEELKNVEIVKQADTIEELCDEFIKIFEDGDRFISKKLNYMCKTIGRRINLSNSVSCQYIAIASIYGAIWTDKGLIYVAKMNSKGVLELL